MGTSVDTPVVVGRTKKWLAVPTGLPSKFSSFHGLLYGIVLTSSNVCWLTIYIYSRVKCSKVSIESKPINVGINVFYAISRLMSKHKSRKNNLCHYFPPFLCYWF
jgi:hypothetical protein